MKPIATLPPDEAVAGRVLHLRVLHEEPLASHDVFLRYHAYLVDQLRVFARRKSLFSADDDLIHDAVADALANYLRRPGQYDPARGKSLGGYLRMAAEGDLLNRVSAGRPGPGVQLVRIEEEEWNNLVGSDGDVAAVVDAAVAADELWERVRVVAETDEERIVLGLMLREERSVRVYAESLGWTHLPDRDQAREVTRVKGRLTKRLRRRFGAELGRSGSGP